MTNPGKRETKKDSPLAYRWEETDIHPDGTYSGRVFHGDIFIFKIGHIGFHYIDFLIEALTAKGEPL